MMAGRLYIFHYAYSSFMTYFTRNLFVEDGTEIKIILPTLVPIIKENRIKPGSNHPFIPGRGLYVGVNILHTPLLPSSVFSYDSNFMASKIKFTSPWQAQCPSLCVTMRGTRDFIRLFPLAGQLFTRPLRLLHSPLGAIRKWHGPELDGAMIETIWACARKYPHPLEVVCDSGAKISSSRCRALHHRKC